MSPSESTADEDPSTATAHATADGEDRPRKSEAATDWFATAALRIGIALLGLALLLVAIGQITGVDIIDVFRGILSSSIGRWLVVAVVAIVMISFAVHGFGRRSR